MQNTCSRKWLSLSRETLPPFSVVLPSSISKFIVEQKFIKCKRNWFEFTNQGDVFGSGFRRLNVGFSLAYDDRMSNPHL